MGASFKMGAYTLAAINKAATNKTTEVDESFVSFDSTFTIKRFDEDGDLKNSTQRQLLYIPKSSIFKAWDFIVHTPPSTADRPHQIVFIQVSIEKMRSHDAVRAGEFLMQNSLTNPMDPQNGIST